MYIDFSKIFHDASKDLTDQGTVHVPKNSKEWPLEWKTTFYKTYEHFKKITLPSVKHPSELFTLIKNRESRMSFLETPISLEEISLLLKYSCGETHELVGGRIGRAQPSGGAEFPIEAYLLVFKATHGLASGVYHYNVQQNSLELLWEREFSSQEISKYFTYEWSLGGSIAIVLTAVFNRTKNKYGQRGYRYILIETGHIGQNVYLISEALGLRCCSIVGTNDTALESLLRIDGVGESVVYALIVGK